MRFVGGTMHGLEVPRQYPFERWDGKAMGITFSATFCWVRLIGLPEERYDYRQWFYAPGRELVPCCVWAGLDEDAFIKLGRALFHAD